MSENLKTIKEMADELGTSKQNLQYHLNFLPSKNRQKNSKGITVLTLEEQGIIKDRVKKTSKKNRQKNGKKISQKINSTVSENQDFDINKYLLNEIEELKKSRDKQLAVKDEQIKSFVESQKQTQNLLDQQQRLALQDKKLLEEYKAENDRLKALNIPTQDVEKEQSSNQPQEKLEALQEQLQVKETTGQQEVPKKWWQFWK